MSGLSPIPVTIIVSMRNSASTIMACLEGLASQKYPILEIIVFDNQSSDQSPELVEAYARRCPVPLKLVRQAVNGGLATSYNMGAAMAKSPFLVLAHSDGNFPSSQELGKLTDPLLRDSAVVAAYPKLLMPCEVWSRFPFWQKCLFSRAVEREISSMCGKFDCIRREVFLKVGGYNTRRFTATCGYGGEDADAHHRIAKAGPVEKSDARVIHLHDLSPNFRLGSLFKTRKLLARTYAKVLLFEGFQPTPGKMSFFVKPVLAVIPLIPSLFWWGVVLLAMFSLGNSWRMYSTRSTLLNPRILLLPLVDAALVYYEAFWFVEGLITPPADAKRSG